MFPIKTNETHFYPQFSHYSPFLSSTSRPQQSPLRGTLILILYGICSRSFLLHFLLVFHKQCGASAGKTGWKTAYSVNCGLLKRHWKQRAVVRGLMRDSGSYSLVYYIGIYVFNVVVDIIDLGWWCIVIFEGCCHCCAGENRPIVGGLYCLYC